MTALLMLPGLLLDRGLFEAQIRALEGEAAVTVPRLDTHDEVGALAGSILDAAPARFALLGLSMGGYVALEMMRRAPERIERLALLDTQAAADDGATRAAREDRIRRAGTGRFEEVLNELHPSWLHPERAADPALRGGMREMAGRIGPDGFVREVRAIMSRPDSRPDLARVGCPTLVLCGREDAVTPVAAHQEMAAAIPEATLVVVPRCGHLAPLERPDAVTAQIRIWLGR